MKYLIAGLGNIGAEYDRTRHNIGFMILDAFATASNVFFTHDRYGDIARTRVKNCELVLLKPSTFMNLSGLAVAGFARKAGIAPEEVLVISDDLDLPVGRLRLRTGGSDGGHNGLKSVIAELGSPSFRRLRIGVGRPEKSGTADYVLSKFDGAEAERFNLSLDAAAEAVRAALTGGMSRAMNKFNAWTIPAGDEEKTNQPQ